MWIVMMAAMMLPSLVPMLQRYHAAVVGASLVSGSGAAGGAHIAVGMRVPRLGWLTTLVGLGYFFVWTVFGLIVYPIGITIADIEMQQPALSRAVPTAIGLVVLIAGALQFTAWKAHHLMCCREEPRPGHALAADAGTAWRLGMRLGLHCSYSSIGMTAILLVVGVMDLRAMAIVTAAITLERLAPSGERIARAIGAVTIAAGVMLMARAAGLA
jgi:predicted metal-binding membrane protein